MFASVWFEYEPSDRRSTSRSAIWSRSVPLPSLIALLRASRSRGQAARSYSGVAMPMTAHASLTTRPSPRSFFSGCRSAFASRSLISFIAPSTVRLLKGQEPLRKQSSTKAFSATSKPFACTSLDFSDGTAGSTAPSSTSARTRLGNRSAYIAPR